ncbi:HrpJ domain-containing protein [Burkholderia ambifaria]|uniref:HrpJ domain-containing protein n=1 Tax=Burkholderia ambifaria TaxID=152480 RepID=UPI001590B65A|nr:HrpJ domain-containing protein [Burkholderia ambifaria]
MSNFSFHAPALAPGAHGAYGAYSVPGAAHALGRFTVETLDAQVEELMDLGATLADMADDVAGMAAHFAAGRAARRSARLATEAPADTSFGEQTEEEQDRTRQVGRIRTLLAQGGQSWETVYRLARALFPDPTDLALLLATLRDEVGLDHTLRAQIDATLATLLEEAGASGELRPALNTAGVVALYARRHRLSRQALRRAYGLFLSAQTDERSIYEHLIDTFGFERRGVALDFLEQAVAVDLSAQTPSRTHDEFTPLRALLARLRLLRSADALLVSDTQHHVVLRATARAALDESRVADPLAHALVTLFLAALTDTNAASARFAGQLRAWEAFAEPERLANWAGDVLRSMARVPVEVFVDAAWREVLLAGLTDSAHAVLDLHYRRAGQQVMHG